MTVAASPSREAAALDRGSARSTSAAPSPAKAMARGHGERCRAALANDSAAPARIHGTGQRAAAVPSPPHQPAPPVAEARLVVPDPVVAHAVVAGAVRRQRVHQERQVPLGEPDHLRGGLRLAGGDEQAPGHVVHAVAVPAPGNRVAGVFEQAGVVGEPGDLRPVGLGRVDEADGRRYEPQRDAHAGTDVATRVRSCSSRVVSAW
nr:hypothetical protein GCM10020092_024820 [Actinoplanes digitatis]